MHWQQLLLDHFKTTHDFSDDDGDSLCAKDVIKEILRLYPPARRVYRRFPGENDDSVADLEKCHQNYKLAGDDAEIFRPSRWVTIRELKSQEAQGMKLRDFEARNLGFLPFATRCPAGMGDTGGFGFKMISFLIGALLEVAMAREFRFDEECLSKHVPLLAGRTSGGGSLVVAKVVDRQDNADARVTRRDGGPA